MKHTIEVDIAPCTSVLLIVDEDGFVTQCPVSSFLVKDQPRDVAYAVHLMLERREADRRRLL